MASRHKAPTEVIIVQEEKSGFAQWVEANWKMGAVVAVAASGLIIGLQLKGDKELAAEIGQWDQLAALVSSGDGTSVADGADALPNPLKDIALLNAASMHAGASDFEAALADLARIGSDTPLLTQLQLPAGPDGSTRSVVDTARSLIEASREQAAALEQRMTNPAPPADAPKVVLDTSEGPVVITLYTDRAPLHAANFLARVDDEYYANTKFHRVLPDRIVQGGDPNTRDGTPDTWGMGGPDEKVESEGDNGLIHVPFSVAMARSGNDPRSSGSQFYITVDREHQWDEDYTVFGVVEDESSRETVSKLCAVEVTGDRPNDPPQLLGAKRQ